MNSNGKPAGSGFHARDILGIDGAGDASVHAVGLPRCGAEEELEAVAFDDGLANGFLAAGSFLEHLGAVANGDLHWRMIGRALGAGPQYVAVGFHDHEITATRPFTLAGALVDNLG